MFVGDRLIEINKLGLMPLLMSSMQTLKIINNYISSMGTLNNSKFKGIQLTHTSLWLSACS